MTVAKWYRTVVRVEVLVRTFTPEDAEIAVARQLTDAVEEGYFDDVDANAHIVGFRFERPDNVGQKSVIDPVGPIPPIIVPSKPEKPSDIGWNL